MEIVCFGQQNWDFCWTGKQHLMTRLAARGHRVLYADPDLSLDTPLSDVPRSLWPVATGLALREVAPRCWVMTHPYSPALRWRLSLRRHPRVLRRCIEKLGFRHPICLTLYPRALPYTDVVPFAARVHYAIDEMTAYGGLPAADRAAVRAQEETLVRRSDLTLAISPRLAERLRALQPATHLLPSGADVEHFAPARIAKQPAVAALAALRQPILGFVGQIDERLDQEIVVALARRVGSVVLVGRAKERVDLSALDAEPNVHRIGYRPFGELPALFGHFDVCIAPYRLDALTHASSPLKVYEFLASGRPVVVTPLDGLGDCRDVVEIAPDADSFCAAVARVLAADHRRDERLAVAQRNSWDRRVDVLEQRLAEALAVAAAR